MSIKAILDSMTLEELRVFLESIQYLKDTVDYQLLLHHLQASDVESSVAAVVVGPLTYTLPKQVLERTYLMAGRQEARTVPPPPDSSVSFRFDMENTRAESWIRNYGADFAVDMSNKQKSALRQHIVDAYSRGDGPSSIARSIVGELNTQTGKRHGGVLGLTHKQIQTIESVRSKLSSGDPSLMSQVTKLSLMDKNSVKAIKKAISQKRSLELSSFTRIMSSYEDSLLRYRARTMARSEVGMAVMQARMESWRQALDKLDYPEAAITRTWRHGGGGESPRIQHIAMNGVSVTGLTDYFDLPDGAKMLHALDPAGGARHCANCTCDTDFEIDYSYGLT